MSQSVRRLGAALLMGAVILPSAADAHGVLGDRFFPATISSDDPFAADELAFPTITHFNHETDYDFDWSKSIFPGFAIGIGAGYVDAKPPGDTPATGFGNLDISPTLEIYRDPKSRDHLRAGVDWEIGGTGSKAVADSRSTYTPTFKYGKGFGDLPDSTVLSAAVRGHRHRRLRHSRHQRRVPNPSNGRARSSTACSTFRTMCATRASPISSPI